jgi:hypothetical protein
VTPTRSDIARAIHILTIAMQRRSTTSRNTFTTHPQNNKSNGKDMLRAVSETT